MNSFLINECAPLAKLGAEIQEWSFLERFPELAFIAKSNNSLGKQLEQSYLNAVEFSERYVAPQALAIDKKMTEDPHYVPEDLLKKACEYKLFSTMFPAFLGGSGLHPICTFITYEVIATHCVGIANLLGVNGLGICCVLASFDPRGLSVITKEICENEKNGIPTFLSTCVTEPGAGSDAEDADEFADAQLTTTAKKVDGGYILNGTKIFISNGGHAQIHAVMAFDADGAHTPDDQMLLLVRAGSKGLSIPRLENKMGQKACHAAEVHFDNVFVPENMMCRKDESSTSSYSYTGIANVLGVTRAAVGAWSTGVAENAYRTALRYARDNDFLGQPMEQQQWVRLELAQLARRAQVARSTYIGALLAVSTTGLISPLAITQKEPKLPDWLKHNNTVRNLREKVLSGDLTHRAFKFMAQLQTSAERDIATGYGDVAKVSCSELALENCQKAITLMGKGGLRHENGAEKLLRDVRLLQIYEGTNQVNMLDYVKRRVIRQFDTQLSL